MPNELSATNEPGATAGDHLLSAAVPTAVAVAAAPATYPRLRAGLGNTRSQSRSMIAPNLSTGQCRRVEGRASDPEAGTPSGCL